MITFLRAFYNIEMIARNVHEGLMHQKTNYLASEVSIDKKFYFVIIWALTDFML